MQQLALPLQCDPGAEAALRRAWVASRLRIPFHVAIHIPALAIGLRHMAELERRKLARRARSESGGRSSNEITNPPA